LIEWHQRHNEEEQLMIDDRRIQNNQLIGEWKINAEIEVP